MSTSGAYREAGVDLEAQERALGQVKKLVRSTFNKSVLSDMGSFGGLFRPSLDRLDEPVLVSSADGVGTKLMVARMAGDYGSVGEDLVNHCVNDILVQGARPLFFLDYVGAGVLEPERMVELVGGVARGCKRNGCALLGGETAEMPGFYQPGDYELVGFIVGLVDRRRLIDGSRIEVGDILVGLPSAGLHTNGFSLARKVLLEKAGLGLGDRLADGSRQSVRDALLAPHLSYLRPLEGLLEHPALRGLAHVTGGGLTDNVPRILPRGTQAVVRLGSWEVPEIFHRIQELGDVDAEEMLRVFNMGVGMVLVVAPDGLREVLGHLRKSKQKAWLIGSVQKGRRGVVYDLERSATTDGGDDGADGPTVSGGED